MSLRGGDDQYLLIYDREGSVAAAANAPSLWISQVNSLKNSQIYKVSSSDLARL